jgi:hypothetical protein
MKKIFFCMLVCFSFGLNGTYQQGDLTNQQGQATNTPTSNKTDYTKPTGQLTSNLLSLPNRDKLSESEFILATQVFGVLQKHMRDFNDQAHGTKAILSFGVMLGALFCCLHLEDMSFNNAIYKSEFQGQQLKHLKLYTIYKHNPALLSAGKWLSGATILGAYVWLLYELVAIGQKSLVIKTQKTFNIYKILNEHEKGFFLDAFDEIQDILEEEYLEKQLHLASDEIEKLYFEIKQIDEKQNEEAKIEKIIKFYQSVLATLIKYHW